MTDGVFTSKQDAILEVILDRPKVNAINSKVSHRLAQIFLEFEDDPTLRVAILSAKGESIFSAGWDLKADEAVDEDHGPGGFAGLTELYTLTKPVIAAVNGLAIGGGFELVLACDLIIAADHAEFFLTESSLGIIPDSGGVLRLPKRLPEAIAMEMLLTGKRMNAERAAHFGLINKVVSKEDLMDRAYELAHDIVAAAPLAVQSIKEIVQKTSHLTVEEGFSWMRNDCPIYQKMLRSEDAFEGQRAFNEKRSPKWKGK